MHPLIKAAVSARPENPKTAIYEIYPIEESLEPLISGVTFNSVLDKQGNWEMDYYESSSAPKLLNKNKVKEITRNRSKVSFDHLPFRPKKENPNVNEFPATRKDRKIEIEFESNNAQAGRLIVFFLKSMDGQKDHLPLIDFRVDGDMVQPKFNGFLVDKDFKMSAQQSGCYSVAVRPGKHHLTLDLKEPWKSDMDIWSIGYEPKETTTVKIATMRRGEPHLVPPQIIPIENLKVNRKVGAIKID